MRGTTFKGNGNHIIASASGRPADIKIIGSIVESESYVPSVCGVDIITNDLVI